MPEPKVKYAVRCEWHGLVPLSDEQYEAQMRRPNALWRCPKCGCDAEWDDDTYEAWAYPEEFAAYKAEEAPDDA